MLQLIHSASERQIPFATTTDFSRTFIEELQSLYLLSLLLTADNDKAEECLISAKCQCGSGAGAGVFIEWTHSWARRAILKHAIQMIKPVPEHSDSSPFARHKGPVTSAENNPLATILALEAFERFVYVMSILEGRSEQDCAILLRCARRDVLIARVLALTRVANTEGACVQADECKPGLTSNSEFETLLLEV